VRDTSCFAIPIKLKWVNVEEYSRNGLRVIDFFREILKGKAPGPAPSFTEFHLIKAIEILGDEVVGRKVLSRKLGLGGGAVRTVIARLENANLISVSREGCKLTDRGGEIYDELRSRFSRMSPVEATPLTVGTHNFGILVRNSAHRVRFGIEQRDAVVKAGARGATVIVFKNGKMIIPTISEDVMSDYPNAAKKIIEIFQPRENDVIIIGGAETRENAEKGARVAALTLINHEHDDT